MSITEHLTENKSKGERMYIPCDRCNRETIHSILTSVEESGREDLNETFSIEWFTEFQIVQCQGCRTITFRKTQLDFESSHHPGHDATKIYYYPQRNYKKAQETRLQSIPLSILEIYRETIKCFNNDCLILCAGGLRAIVEALCENLNVKNGPVVNDQGVIERKDNLEGRINGIEEKGFLTKKAADILHSHRFLGNNALHKLETPDQHDLAVAIRIIEHMLEHIYDLPEQGNKLRKKKN